MPTNIAVVSRDANARDLRGDILAVMKNPDFIAVAAFAAIGLLLTVGLAVYFPISPDVAALASSIT